MQIDTPALARTVGHMATPPYLFDDIRSGDKGPARLRCGLDGLPCALGLRDGLSFADSCVQRGSIRDGRIARSGGVRCRPVRRAGGYGHHLRGASQREQIFATSLEQSSVEFADTGEFARCSVGVGRGRRLNVFFPTR